MTEKKEQTSKRLREVADKYKIQLWSQMPDLAEMISYSVGVIEAYEEFGREEK